MSGDVIATTGTGYNDPATVNGDDGRVHVFREDANGDWALEQTITIPDPSMNEDIEQFDMSDSFGGKANSHKGLALRDDVLVIGAPGKNISSGLGTLTDAGKVYIYRFDPNDSDGAPWNLEKELEGGDTNSGVLAEEKFGFSLSFDGAKLLVGAPAEDSSTLAGAAHVFQFDDSSGSNDWIYEDTLTAASGHGDDEFGTSVQIDGTGAVVGATEGVTSPGFVGIFRYDITNQNWVERSTSPLSPSDGENFDRFGFDIAWEGTTIAVASFGADHPGFPDDQNNLGATYVLENDGGVWVEETKLLADAQFAEFGDRFSEAIAMQSGEVIVCCSGEEDPSDPNQGPDQSGAFYVFRNVPNCNFCP